MRRMLKAMQMGQVIVTTTTKGNILNIQRVSRNRYCINDSPMSFNAALVCVRSWLRPANNRMYRIFCNGKFRCVLDSFTKALAAVKHEGGLMIAGMACRYYVGHAVSDGDKLSVLVSDSDIEFLISKSIMEERQAQLTPS